MNIKSLYYTFFQFQDQFRIDFDFFKEFKLDWFPIENIFCACIVMIKVQFDWEMMPKLQWIVDEVWKKNDNNSSSFQFELINIKKKRK